MNKFQEHFFVVPVSEIVAFYASDKEREKYKSFSTYEEAAAAADKLVEEFAYYQIIKLSYYRGAK